MTPTKRQDKGTKSMRTNKQKKYHITRKYRKVPQTRTPGLLSVPASCCSLDYFSTVLSGSGLFALLPPQSTAHPPPLFHSHMSSHRLAAPGSQWNWRRVFNVQRQACCLVLSKVSGGKRELKNEARKRRKQSKPSQSFLKTACIPHF